MKKSRFIHRL